MHNIMYIYIYTHIHTYVCILDSNTIHKFVTNIRTNISYQYMSLVIRRRRRRPGKIMPSSIVHSSCKICKPSQDSLRNSLAETESRVLFTFFLRIHRARKRPFNECWILISARPPPNNWGGCFRLVNFERPGLKIVLDTFGSCSSERISIDSFYILSIDFHLNLQEINW